MLADNALPACCLFKAVEIVESLGEWFVRVIENGTEHVAVFVVESLALSYAEGQRVRLGLDCVTRL
jgi:hypothetical protein